MREIAIQFSAPMVRAERAGTKTVTRRTVKGEIPADAVRAVFDQWAPGRAHAWRWLDQHGAPIGKPFRCPYGAAGDRLWVREAWRTTSTYDHLPPKDVPVPSPVQYIADGDPLRTGLAGKFRQGMFMPRWASRDLLEVTGVTCERLQSITPLDAIAEGIERDTRQLSDGDWRDYLDTGHAWPEPVRSYRSLWDSLNGEDGPDSWVANPWVFAISFRRITP